MATTTTIPRDIDENPPRGAGRRHQPSMIRRVLAPLASLRLTVVLMGMAVFIVLAGTLAQAEVGTETAVTEYFRVRPWGPNLGFAWIPLQIFFPESFFPNLLFDARPIVPGGFPFPGGWLIGSAMFVNLLAAHAVRFSVQGKGWRLLGGIATILFGIFVTAAVVASGTGFDGPLQAKPLVSWDVLWRIFQAQVLTLAAVNIGLAIWLRQRGERDRRYFWVAVAALPISIGLAIWALFAPQVGDSSMRILWQLIKGSMAALILLAGCWLVFRKRAGIVLLHSGVALLMISELMVGMLAVETRMSLAEGETSSWAFDLNQVELAVVDPSNPDYNVLTRFPEKLLDPGSTLSHESVPFQIRIDKYFPNAGVVRAGEGEQDRIDSGLAKGFVALEKPEATGATVGQAADQPAIYVTLLSKDGERLGSYLLSVAMATSGFIETVPTDGKDWRVSLRFRRDYKPYSVTLLDVEKNDYVGTDTAKGFSSNVQVVSSELGVDFERKIWMNNPLRFAGETLYQSGYTQLSEGDERTTLQIVKNTGWMLPYVACMIVVIGMLAQFLITLSRFLFRRAEMGSALPTDAESGLANQTAATSDRRNGKGDAGGGDGGHTAATDDRWNWKGWLIPGLVVVIFAGWLAGKFVPPRAAPGEFDLIAFGELPVASHGRVKPLETLARDALKALSNNRQEFKTGEAYGPFKMFKEKKPAVQWLLEIIATPQKGAERRVVRIDNGELLSTLELPGPEQRDGHVYSIAEVTDPETWDALRTRLEEIEAKSQAGQTLTAVDQAALDLKQKIGVIDLLVRSFQPDFGVLSGGLQGIQEYSQQYRILKFGDQTQIPPIPSRNPPLAIWYSDPLFKQEDRGQAGWETLGHALLIEGLFQFAASENGETHTVDPAVAAWTDILNAWKEQDETAFNAAVTRYATLVKEQSPQGYDVGKVEFEAYFKHAAPFYYLMIPYVFAALLVCGSWMGFARTLNRTALCLIIMTFVLHTLALAGRIYISGRPPVTNLYSSAIFIGWAAVVFGIALEMFFRLGFGSVLAGVMGFASLLIAHNLSGDGTDTFAVLVAVLDTQFWLATHVVTVTLGYAATFVAGFLALLYIILGFTTQKLGNQWGEGNRRQTMGQTLIRMIYGVLCFALLFSFFGTVLGGLWADDSWGRFWGWDPKENGALMIVLWNALVLHARWGAIVKDRGLAVLAVLGNIVVSWSWFGTNQLGVGLHSYGFTSGVVTVLGLFVVSQLTVALAGCLPKSWWVSFRNRPVTE